MKWIPQKVALVSKLIFVGVWEVSMQNITASAFLSSELQQFVSTKLCNLMFVYIYRSKFNMCSFWSKKENYLTLIKIKFMETGNRWSVYTSLITIPVILQIANLGASPERFFTCPKIIMTLSSVLESKVKIICQIEGRSYLLSQNVNKLSRFSWLWFVIIGNKNRESLFTL